MFDNGFAELLASFPSPILIIPGVCVFWVFFKYLSSQWNGPYRHLPGPPRSSFWYGNLRDVHKDETNSLHDVWIEKYGSTFTYRGFLGRQRLYTVDVKAIQYVLNHDYDYQKMEATRYVMHVILGDGVLATEGDKHKAQRKIMNPAFGPAQIREFTDVFLEKSFQLRDVWVNHIMKNGERSEIDVLAWFSKATLDIIGLAGFNYNLNMLSDETNPTELHETLKLIFQMASATQMNVLRILQAYFPVLRILPSAFDPGLRNAKRTMLRIGQQLLDEARKFQMGTGQKGSSSMQARDLLSLLVKSNMSEEVSATQRMSDEDVIAQVPTFLVAGHETTSTALAWVLFALSQFPTIQTRLRDELLSLHTDNPTMEELNSLSYLDAVVRETLRLYSPVTSPNRVAMKDDVIPLSRPFTDKYGVVHDTIAIKKGHVVTIPIVSLNRDKSLWGEDATQFKPERWFDPPEAITAIPGVWGNMLTFLGGPRSCIGWRFAVVEMKALLFTLVRTFEYELAVPPEDIIVKRMGLLQKPVVKSMIKGGKDRQAHMPIRIKLLKQVA